MTLTFSHRLIGVCAVLALAAPARPGFAQLTSSAEWAAHAANQYQVFPNITYLTASNYEAKMDIYVRRGATTPQRTVVYFHGGFWAAGSKEGSLMSLMPWLEMGWTVVNVEYRLARVALAPAAVEVARRLVRSGRSAVSERAARPQHALQEGTRRHEMESHAVQDRSAWQGAPQVA